MRATERQDERREIKRWNGIQTERRNKRNERQDAKRREVKRGRDGKEENTTKEKIRIERRLKGRK